MSALLDSDAFRLKVCKGCCLLQTNQTATENLKTIVEFVNNFILNIYTYLLTILCAYILHWIGSFTIRIKVGKFKLRVSKLHTYKVSMTKRKKDFWIFKDINSM